MKLINDEQTEMMLLCGADPFDSMNIPDLWDIKRKNFFGKNSVFWLLNP